MLEEVKNSFVRLMQILLDNEEPTDALSKEILDICMEIDLATLHCHEDVGYSLLVDWLVGGYLKLMNLFFFAWSNDLFRHDEGLREEFRQTLDDLVARFETSKLDQQAILNLAFDLTNLQEKTNNALVGNRKQQTQ